MLLYKHKGNILNDSLLISLLNYKLDLFVLIFLLLVGLVGGVFFVKGKYDRKHRCGLYVSTYMSPLL